MNDYQNPYKGAPPKPNPMAIPQNPAQPHPIVGCPNCNQSVTIHPAHQNQLLKCPHCGQILSDTQPPNYAQPVQEVVQCRYCKASGPPYVREKISTGGWIVFALFLLFFFPLFWIGLLIKDKEYLCGNCGAYLH